MNCNRKIYIYFLRTLYYPLFILKTQHEEADISVQKLKEWGMVNFKKRDQANFKVK